MVRIKEHDLFPDNAEQRHLAKQLNLVFLFWWKANNYIEGINTPMPLMNSLKTVPAFKAMNEVKIYFDKVKIEDQIIPEFMQTPQMIKADEKEK